MPEGERPLTQAKMSDVARHRVVAVGDDRDHPNRDEPSDQPGAAHATSRCVRPRPSRAIHSLIFHASTAPATRPNRLILRIT